MYNANELNSGITLENGENIVDKRPLEYAYKMIINMILNHYFRIMIEDHDCFNYWSVGPEVTLRSIRYDDEPDRWSIPDFVVFRYKKLDEDEDENEGSEC